MRICLVAQEYPPVTALGGIGSQTWNKAHALTQLGHDVEVLSSGLKGWPECSTDIEDGIVVHRLGPPGETAGAEMAVNTEELYWLAHSWDVARALYRLEASQPFDVIDVPEYVAEGFAYQLNRSAWHGSPVVVQLHGPLAMFVDRIGWPDEGSSFARVVSFMEGESITRADAVMSCSANIADYTAGRYNLEREAISVVHCGVDAASFAGERPRATAEHRPTVLFVGNIEANKGVGTALEAVLRLRPQHPRILLQIVGKDSSFQRDLEKRVAQEDAAENVEFLGFVDDRRALPDLYRTADVFCSPAHHEVGVANVYIEAMASGCPVVASLTGAAPEAIADGETGFLVAPGDDHATAQAVGALLADPGLARDMGRRGRRRVEEYFSMDHYIQRVLTTYERARASRNAEVARNTEVGA